MSSINYPHVEAADGYIQGVLSGVVPACKWTALACERQLEDLERAKKKSSPIEWHPELGNKVCKFVELMPHIKGEWAKLRLKITLEPWMSFMLTTVFGWIRTDGFRRFRNVYIEVARKNAKSTIAAGVGNYMFAADGEEGAEVYSAATAKDQAKIVFLTARLMARKTPSFVDRFGIDVRTHNMNIPGNASKFEPLSSDSDTLEGLNVHCALIDELHAHKTREVFDVLDSAAGARSQPLIWVITTAGSNRAGICYEQHLYVKKILEGSAIDDSYFGIIYSIDENDDWTDPEVWVKANPNMNVSVKEDDIARQCRKAMEMSSAQNNFLTKRLNVWVNADSSWMDMKAWEKCGDSALCLEDFEGCQAYIGLDLASKVDIAAMVILIEKADLFYCFGFYYLPEERVENSTNSQYEGWALDENLITTPGNVIDYSRIETDLKDLAGRFDVKNIGFDPWNATQFASNMIDDGLGMVEIRASTKNYSEPMKNIEALVLSGKLKHDSNPVLTWMVSNVVCHTDANDNIFPRKQTAENKIDGVIGLIMCLHMAMKPEEEEGDVRIRYV